MPATDVFGPRAAALITGGASGIGLAIAKLCHRKGMKVFLVDHNAAALQQAKAEIAADNASGAAVFTSETDVSQPEAWKALTGRISSTVGSIDLLVLNAGTHMKGSWDDQDFFKKTFDVNFYGVVCGLSACLPFIKEASKTKATSIVITGSKQGITNPPGNPAYNASKAAVKSIAEHLCWDLNQQGEKTSVHLLVPGWTFTALTKGSFDEKPAGAWTAEQVAEHLYRKMSEDKFYICPDNDVSETLDKQRMLWSTGDMVKERPPLSRWRPEWKSQAEDEINKTQV